MSQQRSRKKIDLVGLSTRFWEDRSSMWIIMGGSLLSFVGVRMHADFIQGMGTGIAFVGAALALGHAFRGNTP